MDTSKEYIKMCEKAVEIQSPSVWKPIAGDWYDSRGNTEKKGPKVLQILNNFRALRYDKNIKSIHRHIWLPRQDQLQEMVMEIMPYKNCSNSVTNLIDTFSHEVLSGEDKFIESTVSMNSMEQLWLAFVMKEKFSKTWNGEGWK